MIAANEGKLTKFLSNYDELLMLRQEVKLRFFSHNNNSEMFSVINLLDVTSSVYVERVLEEWNKEENWSPCYTCGEKNRCVIYHNHKKTSQEHVQRRIVNQYRLLDFLQTHITMREMLIHISYMLTGGYTCKDIHNAGYIELEEQTRKVYYQNFYGYEAQKDAFSEMQALKVFKGIDPGQYSHSSLDDFIINGDISGDSEIEQVHNDLFNEELDMQFGYFKKRLIIYRDHNKDSNDDLIEQWIEKLRRKVYFEVPEDFTIDRTALLPYKYLNEYAELFESQSKQAQIKRDIIKGLNRAFSKRLVESGSYLYATTENLMIYGDFKPKEMSIDQEPERNDIDHNPSKFILSVGEFDLPLNLSVFEYS